ncbi:MAG: hypothetical protein AAF772_01625 [Acidobacteriota bacterium]
MYMQHNPHPSPTLPLTPDNVAFLKRLADDDTLRAAFESNPNDTLAAHGIAISIDTANLDVRVPGKDSLTQLCDTADVELDEMSIDGTIWRHLPPTQPQA